MNSINRASRFYAPQLCEMAPNPELRGEVGASVNRGGAEGDVDAQGVDDMGLNLETGAAIVEGASQQEA